MSIGNNSSVWYNSNLRGDIGSITVGQNSLLQDLVSVISKQPKTNTVIGNNVVVAPNVLLESCTLEDNSFIGMGGNVRQGAQVKSFAVVAAGAMIPENTTVPSNQVLKFNGIDIIKIFEKDLGWKSCEIFKRHYTRRKRGFE